MFDSLRMKNEVVTIHLLSADKSQQEKIIQLPSNWQMTKNLVQAGFDVIKGGTEIRSAEEIETVLKICEKCSFFIANEWGGRCGKCGCKTSIKAALSVWHCPIDKW